MILKLQEIGEGGGENHFKRFFKIQIRLSHTLFPAPRVVACGHQEQKEDILKLVNSGVTLNHQ